jgi:hypothetical protein
MTHTLKNLLVAACAVLALLGACSAAGAVTARREANGAIRYYDDNGNDRGYAWCLKRSGRQFSGWSDCRYFSYAQCRASVFPPGGDCEPNPFSYYVQVPPQAKPRRR